MDKHSFNERGWRLFVYLNMAHYCKYPSNNLEH